VRICAGSSRLALTLLPWVRVAVCASVRVVWPSPCSVAVCACGAALTLLCGRLCVWCGPHPAVAVCACGAALTLLPWVRVAVCACGAAHQGATATMEAWTTDEKPNLSWSHPWASAPASAIAWGLFGIRALVAGWSRFEVRPRPGDLEWATIRVPSLAGPIDASFNQSASYFGITLHVPAEAEATVCLPSLGLASPTVSVDGRPVDGHFDGPFVCVAPIRKRPAGVRLVRAAPPAPAEMARAAM
jgi:hypothetical protein